MRCDEVAQELSAPSGRLDHDAMAAHLAACSCCAGWLENMERLDRLWEATRPDGPPAIAFHEVWANVNQAIATSSKASKAATAHLAQNGQTTSATATVLAFEPKRTRLAPWVAGLVASIAVAAALGLVFLKPIPQAPKPNDPTQAAQLQEQVEGLAPAEIDPNAIVFEPVPLDHSSGQELAQEPPLSSFDLEQGGVPIIHIGESGPPRVEERPLTPVSDTETIAASFDMLNYVETLSDFQGAF